MTTAVTTKEKPADKTKFQPRVISEISPASLRKKISDFSYGFIFPYELDKILKEVTGDKKATCLNLTYIIRDKTTTYILDDNFNPIKKNHQEKGYPIKIYDEETKEIIGFTFLGDDLLDDFSYIEEDTDLDDFYGTVVENQEDDILFQHMLHIIY